MKARKEEKMNKIQAGKESHMQNRESKQSSTCSLCEHEGSGSGEGADRVDAIGGYGAARDGVPHSRRRHILGMKNEGVR